MNSVINAIQFENNSVQTLPLPLPFYQNMLAYQLARKPIWHKWIRLALANLALALQLFRFRNGFSSYSIITRGYSVIKTHSYINGCDSW